MHRVLLTLPLLLLLVSSRVGAQDADVLFSLPLPTRPDGARAIETLEDVVISMGAHLKHEEGREDASAALAWLRARCQRPRLISIGAASCRSRSQGAR